MALKHLFDEASIKRTRQRWSPSRSLDFRPEQEPESTLKSVQGPIKILKGPIKISISMLVVKQNGITWDAFCDQRRHISQKCDTGWDTEHFTTDDGFRSWCLCKIQCV